MISYIRGELADVREDQVELTLGESAMGFLCPAVI